MSKLNNIENTGSDKGNLQSRKETVVKSARKYFTSVALTVAAVLTILFTSTGTAQAQNDRCYYERDGSIIKIYCPIDNDSGYYYNQINGRWVRTHYYKGASTNILYQQDLASGTWYALDKATRVLYLQTPSGWVNAIDYLRALLANYQNTVAANSRAGSSNPLIDAIRNIKNSSGMTEAEKQRAYDLILSAQRTQSKMAEDWSRPPCYFSYNGCR